METTTTTAQEFLETIKETTREELHQIKYAADNGGERSETPAQWKARIDRNEALGVLGRWTGVNLHKLQREGKATATVLEVMRMTEGDPEKVTPEFIAKYKAEIARLKSLPPEAKRTTPPVQATAPIITRTIAAAPVAPKPVAIDPVTEWNTALYAMKQKHKGDNAKAVAELARTSPALHQRYLQAFNAKRKTR